MNDSEYYNEKFLSSVKEMIMGYSLWQDLGISMPAEVFAKILHCTFDGSGLGALSGGIAAILANDEQAERLEALARDDKPIKDAILDMFSEDSEATKAMTSVMCCFDPSSDLVDRTAAMGVMTGFHRIVARLIREESSDSEDYAKNMAKLSSYISGSMDEFEFNHIEKIYELIENVWNSDQVSLRDGIRISLMMDFYMSARGLVESTREVASGYVENEISEGNI